jgi:hypothetical protein
METSVIAAAAVGAVLFVSALYFLTQSGGKYSVIADLF